MQRGRIPESSGGRGQWPRSNFSEGSPLSGRPRQGNRVRDWPQPPGGQTPRDPRGGRMRPKETGQSPSATLQGHRVWTGTRWVTRTVTVQGWRTPTPGRLQGLWPPRTYLRASAGTLPWCASLRDRWVAERDPASALGTAARGQRGQ